MSYSCIVQNRLAGGRWSLLRHFEEIGGFVWPRSKIARGVEPTARNVVAKFSLFPCN